MSGLNVTIRGPREIETREILPDVWMLGGYLSGNFFLRPPSSNTYLLRDGDTLYIIDPGGYRSYQPRIIELVEAYRHKGISRVRLLVTQGHFDHDSNDDVVRSTGLDWQFYLPEAEVPTMDAVADFMRDIDRIARYEDVFRTMFARAGALGRAFGGISRLSPAAAKAALRLAVTPTMGTGHHLANEATLLAAGQKVARTFGSVTLHGWELGRFFLIHDGSHSPGHVCVYDPLNRLMLTGDVTVEINPAMTYSSMSRLAETAASLATMAREGAIEYVADGHRSAAYFRKLLRELRLEPLDDTQLLDVAKGPGECQAFLDFFHTYYQELTGEVLATHARLGRATVADIVDELYRSDNRYMRFKAGLTFPRVPSRMDVLVIQVLSEAGATRITTGDRVMFEPAR